MCNTAFDKINKGLRLNATKYTMEAERTEKTAEAEIVDDFEVNLPVKDEKFYTDAKEYWDSVSPTVDGMLGGYAKISPTDINGSRAFMRPLLKVD